MTKGLFKWKIETRDSEHSNSYLSSVTVPCTGIYHELNHWSKWTIRNSYGLTHLSRYILPQNCCCPSNWHFQGHWPPASHTRLWLVLNIQEKFCPLPRHLPTSIKITYNWNVSQMIQVWWTHEFVLWNQCMLVCLCSTFQSNCHNVHKFIPGHHIYKIRKTFSWSSSYWLGHHITIQQWHIFGLKCGLLFKIPH